MNIWKKIADRKMTKGFEMEENEIGSLTPIGFENRKAITGNAMMVINPWKQGGMWVFNDEARGLAQEPFVMGIPEMIEKMLSLLSIPEDSKDLKFIFSENAFPKYHVSITKTRDDCGGAWYKVEKSNIGDINLDEGWLCPATLLYFKEMPDNIYIRIEE